MNDQQRLFIPYVTKEAVWEIADTFYKKYNPGDTIPLDIHNIIEHDLGIPIVPENGLKAATEADAYINPCFDEITVDTEQIKSEKFAYRLRFSLAHEIGHYVLHKHIIENLDLSTLDKHMRFIELIEARDYKSAEIQANHFAARLLVPTHHFNLQLELIKPIIADAKKMIPNVQQDFLRSVVATFLHQKFEVSSEVIEIKIYNEGITL